MTSPILIDTNVVMYAAGREHRLKPASIEILSLAADNPRSFLTDAEVLQELLHRYLAMRRWAADGRAIFREFCLLMEGRIEPIYDRDVQAAARLADFHPTIAARDLLHAAVMGRLGVRRVVSADRDFDHLPDIQRLDPAAVDVWRADVESA